MSSLRVAVVGAGAVGGWIGFCLASHGARVVLIGRSPMVEAVTRDGLTLLRGASQETVACEASTELAACRDAELVLLCVKSTDTESAAAALAPHLGADATVVSLQNGVGNAERAARVLGRPVLAAAVYVGVEVERPGVVRHLGRGDLVLDAHPAGPLAPETLSSLFTRAGVPCVLTDAIEPTLWRKLIINCAYNALSALARQPYGVLLQDPVVRELMVSLAGESLAVARASGVALDETAELAGLWRIGEAMPGQYSSTAQDILRGRRTEIDALNGLIARRGAELGIPTPANAQVTALLRLLERASRAA